MSPAPQPAPPASPGASKTPPGGVLGWIKARNDATQARWDAVLEIPRVRRTRFLAKVVAIHARYTCGYLMTGFIVSGPIQLGRGKEGGGAIFASILLGLAFLLPFVALIPFTKIAWEKMRLPEFKNLELGLTRWALIASVGLLLFTWCVQAFAIPGTPLTWLFDPHLAWVNLVLMLFAWVRVQFDAWLFREFYTLHPDDDTLVLFRLPADMRRAPARAPGDAAIVEPPPPATVVEPSGASPSGASPSGASPSGASPSGGALEAGDGAPGGLLTPGPEPAPSGEAAEHGSTSAAGPSPERA